MSLSGTNEQRRIRCRVGALIGVALLLAGCSSAPSGGSSEAPATSRISSFFSSPKTAAAPGATAEPSAVDFECPGVDIRRGTGTMNVAAKTDQATAGDLRYQLSLRQTARECLVQGAIMTVRVGVQGRIILGPYGGPGQLDIPLRYAVVQEGAQPRTIVTKFKRFSAAVPPNETNVEFTDVEEGLSFPLPSRPELESYVIYVGFDEIGDPNEKKPAKKAAKKPGR